MSKDRAILSALDFVFFLFAFIAVGAAVMVVILDNAVHSAMWLILNLISIAVLYYLLKAPFLMVVQMIVYAGAIVVLFVFVLMLLTQRRQSTATRPLAWLSPATFVAALLLGVLLLMVAFAQTQGAPNAAGGLMVGTPSHIGEVLYRDYLLPFEATSVLLLAALVGSMYLGRHSARGESAEDQELEESLSGGPVDDSGPAEEAAPIRIPEDVHV